MTRSLIKPRKDRAIYRDIEDKEEDLFRRIISHAYEYSHDPASQNAAALVDYKTKRLRVLQANRFPTNVERTPERLVRPEKYKFIEHAERKALYLACSEGIATSMMAMYCPWFACAECARGIIEAKIFKVVGIVHEDESINKRWADTCEVGNIMLDESCVRREYVRIPHLGLKIIRDGVEIDI
jgi:dCMP deaminase